MRHDANLRRGSRGEEIAADTANNARGFVAIGVERRALSTSSHPKEGTTAPELATE